MCYAGIREKKQINIFLSKSKISTIVIKSFQRCLLRTYQYNTSYTEDIRLLKIS